MVRRASFVIPSIVCLCLAGANFLHAGTTTSSEDNAVRQLRQFKTLLSLEVARGANDPTLPGYFRKVAGAFRKVGYPGIGHVLELSGASSLQNLAGQYTGHITSLDDSNNFMARLESAIGVAKSANDPQRLDYLSAAQRFLHGFSSVVNDLETRRANDAAAANTKGNGGKYFSGSATVTVSYGSTPPLPKYTPTPPTNSYNTGGVTKSGTATLTLAASSFISNSTGPYPKIFNGGTTWVGPYGSKNWGDTTVEAPATLDISSGTSITLSSGSTFKLLGTLSADLAPTFVTPITGTDTSTFALETGATLNVKNSAPGTYTILSGFQATGDTLGTVTITGLASSQTGTLTQANGSVTLTITAASPTPSPTP
jgi:hypothetical protein